MPASKPYAELSETTKKIYAVLNKAELSPRAKMALRMYAFGAVKTLGEAAEAVGITQAWLSQKKNSPAGQAYMKSAQQILDDKSASTAQVLEQLGRRGLEIIGQIVEDTSDKKLQLRAAIDLADRAPAYSKVQKVQVESFSLAGKDAKAIADALVAGISVNEQFAHLAAGDFDKVSEAKEPLMLPPGDANESAVSNSNT